VENLDLKYQGNWSIKEFILENQMIFEQELLDEAINVKDKIEEIRYIGNINLLNNAKKLVAFIVEKQTEDLINFANQEGIAWAKYSLTLSFKLEWIHAIRRTLWRFLNQYDLFAKEEVQRETFFELEKNINDQIDQFLTSFFISYSKYKDELLEKQRQLVENLSVPIIPIKKEIRILPLIGSIDLLRIKTIQEKVLEEIGKHHIQTLIIDLSGIMPMEEETTHDLKKIIEAIAMMGCQTVITGLRTEIVQSLVTYGVDLKEHAEFKGTLQLALNEIIFGESLHS
jgi:rsbT co-antagonist protein RsbR